MDTAQRGSGLVWADAKKLIGHALDAAKTRPGVKICCGVGTDHLDPASQPDIDCIIGGFEEQIEATEAMGGKLVIMASRALARAAKTSADYERVYSRILRQVKEPVIIHWLGEMFDPALTGYWGSADHWAAMSAVPSSTVLRRLPEFLAKLRHFSSDLLHPPLAQSRAEGDIRGDIRIGGAGRWRDICSRQGG
jgi:hypothetical protein